MKILLILMTTLSFVQPANALMSCRHWDLSLSNQMKELCQLKAVARRLQNGVRRLPMLYLRKEGKTIRCLTKHYNNSVKKLSNCASFTKDNTHQDRVLACGKLMKETWDRLFVLSDYFEWHIHFLSDDKFDIMIHNRHSMELLNTYTKWKGRQDRSYNDWRYNHYKDLEPYCGKWKEEDLAYTAQFE